MLRSAALLLVLGLAACAPRLTPTYRDFEVRAAPAAADTLIEARLARAAQAAGWALADADAPGVVSTERRGVGGRTEAALDLVPLDGGFVRVYVRARKRSLLGGRGKVFSLDGRLRRVVLGDLTRALEAEGLVPLGTPKDRDEEATDT